ncbi:MAG: efflux RND transporter permease subunit [Rikenellaceae bacterium]
MNIKRFIDRPILAGVISVLILFVGAIGLFLLPVEQFPEIAPPTISVSASYAGASAETALRSVAVPLEEAINGVEDMLYMTSTTTSIGSVSISIYFRQGTDPDMALINVQNLASTAERLLPAEVVASGVTVKKSQSSNVKILAIHCPDNRYDDIFISNYAKINIEPRLARVKGVGDVGVRGPEYSLRVWLDPLKMAQYNLMPSDIDAVLDNQNVEYSTGTLGIQSDNAFQYDLLYKGRLDDNVDFENLIIKSLPNGSVLYLKDVAEIELNARDFIIYGGVDGHLGRTIMISQISGSNANDVVDGLDAELEGIRASLPAGLVVEDLFDVKDFLDASIKNVVWTLIQAILLVILVVYIFLQNFRSTIIPSISIVVALVGTFTFLYIFGFSINLLTLFALVLVIGTVVDDAIVVVEAVQSKFDIGYRSPYLATIDAMGEITSALVTTTVVFMAVFIPVCFIDGTMGTFYTQFGITMAVAVALSTLNALTLSPALCALIMQPHQELSEGKKASFSTRFHVAFETAFNRIVNNYRDRVFFFLKHKNFSFVLVLLACGALYYLVNNTRTAFVPNEDMGTIYVNIQSPAGYSYSETAKIADEVEKRIKDIEEMRIYSSVVGVSMLGGTGATNAMFIVKLKDWEFRPRKDQSIDVVVKDIYERTADISGASIMVITPPMISGFGMNSGFSLYVQDQKGGSIEDLTIYTKNFIAALESRDEVSRAQTTFDINYPQYLIDVDAALCERNGVSPSDVLKTISVYVGGSYASNMNKFAKLYRVMVQASPEYRLDIESLNNMYVRNDDGEMSPVSHYVSVERIYGSQSLTRFNLFPSIAVNGTPADGYSSGEAIQAIREVAKETLPIGYGYAFSGMSLEEAASSGNTTMLIFAICIVFVYLILCALYESIFIPFAVILSVPFGLMGSYLFASVFGLSSDIYLQTGLIMLIGLLAKTAILLTEYASERRRTGMSITQSAIMAAKVRLRPILMTSMTLIFGMIPLVFATGVGANSNISLGVGVVGGMLIGTIALIFIVPALFVIFQGLEECFMPKRVLPSLDEKRF